MSFAEDDQTFAVMANVSHSEVDHSQFAALKAKGEAEDARRPSLFTRIFGWFF